MNRMLALLFACSVWAIPAQTYAGERISKEMVLKHFVGPTWLGELSNNRASFWGAKSSGNDIELKYERNGTLEIYVPNHGNTFYGNWKVDDKGNVCTEFRNNYGSMFSSCRYYEYSNKPPGISIFLVSGGALELSGSSEGGISIFEQPAFQEKRQGAVAAQLIKSSPAQTPPSSPSPLYWAGYKSQLITNESSCCPQNDEGLPATLHIEYSKDGRTYSAWWHYAQKDGGIGKCSGKVDQSGSLETTDCTPKHKGQTRELSGTILKIEISGGYWHEPIWHDETLKKNKGKLLAIAVAEKKRALAEKKQAKAPEPPSEIIKKRQQLAANPIDGIYYAEDQNENDVSWKLYLEVANKEISARVSRENCGACRIDPASFECGSTALDTNGKFELWCRRRGLGSRKFSGNLDKVTSGRQVFKIIPNSELAKFNRFKAETGIHKTAAYISEQIRFPETAEKSPPSEIIKKRQQLAANPIDGIYYAEDQNENDVSWKLYLEVANKEISARVSRENCGACRIDPASLECGSTALDTNGKFELWCTGRGFRGSRKFSGNLDKVKSGRQVFKIIPNSELAKFNRFKAETGIHKTAAYISEQIALERTRKLAESKRKSEGVEKRGLAEQIREPSSSTKSGFIDRSKLRALVYTNEANERVEFMISKITPNLIQFNNDTSLFANFIHDGGSPYSPGHSNLDTYLQDKEKINKDFLNSPIGTRLSYKIEEEWNSTYDMLWKIDAEIIDRKKINLRGLYVDAVKVQIRGESISSTSSSSWAEEGIRFTEKLLIDSSSKIILTLDRVWESTTSNSPPGVQRLVLKEYQLKNGSVVTLQTLSRLQVADAKRKAAEEAMRRASQVKEAADKIRRVQAALKKIGLYKGSVDGSLTPTTLHAILKWSKESEFSFNGTVSPALISLIELDASDSVQAERKRKAEAAEKRRLAKLAEAGKKRQAEMARRKAEAARLAAKAEKRRLAKLAEAGKKRQAEIARRKAEEKRSVDFTKGFDAYERGDYATALHVWKPLANQGFAEAQYFRGLMYENGKGISKDDKLAVKWYTLAAKQGDVDAQYSLGGMYDFGQGVPEDDKEAMKWYRLAAEQGDTDAQKELEILQRQFAEASAEDLSTSAREFIAVNPGTPGMLDIMMSIANTKTALQKKNLSSLLTALASLQAALSKEKGYSAFLVVKKKERQERFAENKRLVEAERKRQLAEEKRREKKTRRRLAAQVRIEQDNLRSYVAFLKNQITKAVMSDPEMVKALIPMIRSLEGGLSSNELSVLQGLMKQADATLKKHGLRKNSMPKSRK